LIFLSNFTLSVRGEETFIGSVKSAQGHAVVRRGSGAIPASEGLRLELNDVLVTSADGRLGAILGDGTRLSLGPNTELTVDRFVYQPAEGKFDLLLRLGRGLLAYISGRIARISPQSVTLETPVGVIGLRGTKFAVSIEGR
jgi:hypothetical protein